MIYQFVNESTEKVEDQTEVVKIKDLYEAFKVTDLFANMDKRDKRKFKEAYFKEQVQNHTQFRKHYKNEFQSAICLEKYGVKKMRNVLMGFQMEKKEEDE